MATKLTIFANIIACLFTAPMAYNRPKDPILASIHDIKARPLSYDEMVVRVSGWALSHHMGLSLTNEDGTETIVLRMPYKEFKNSAYPIHKDGLYKKFDELTNIESQLLEYKMHVELIGYVKLLKEDGKVAKEFDVFGQWPIELVALQIIKVDLVNKNTFPEAKEPSIPIEGDH